MVEVVVVCGVGYGVAVAELLTTKPLLQAAALSLCHFQENGQKSKVLVAVTLFYLKQRSLFHF